MKNVTKEFTGKDSQIFDYEEIKELKETMPVPLFNRIITSHNNLIIKPNGKERIIYTGSTMGSLYHYPQSVLLRDYVDFINEVNETQFFIKPDSAFFDYGFIYIMMKDLTGKLLTLLDASLDESAKSKAIKNLVRKTLKDKIEEFSDFNKCIEEPNYKDVLNTYNTNFKEISGELKKQAEEYDYKN